MRNWLRKQFSKNQKYDNIVGWKVFAILCGQNVLWHDKCIMEDNNDQLDEYVREYAKVKGKLRNEDRTY